ncbi:MAG TPA: YciI family protein [Jatrophihabitans sp.]|nr:YciI family protein [Jatrophihabitans sp.]
MRVMVLVKENEEAEAGQLPPDEVFVEMGKFNEKLVEAGVMLAADGLAPSSKGKRVAFATDGSTTVIDGPFTEAKELVAGFWIWQVSSMDEAVEWIKRSPFRGTEIELRQIMETEDFGDELPPEVRESELRMREKLAERQ